MKIFLRITGCVVALFAGLTTLATRANAADDVYESPNYSVVSRMGDIEIRDYAPQLVAEVTVTGDRSAAANKGFRVLADFIFGGNQSETSMSMTAPVTQEVAAPEDVSPAPRSIEPVGDDENAWRIRFMMPSRFTKATLPQPNDARIVVREMSGYRAAAIRFTGFWTQSNLQEHAQILSDFVKTNALQTTGKPAYAFYNDPFTWPWSRRNEVIVALAPEAALKQQKPSK